MNDPAYKILLIESDPGNTRLFQEYLATARDPRFETITARRLSSGLTRLAGRFFDAVLLDLQLPDNQGIDGLVKVLAQAHNTPVLVISDVDDPAAARTALRLGAQDCLLTSELSARALTHAVQFAIERSRTKPVPTESKPLFPLFAQPLDDEIANGEQAKAHIANLAKFPSENPNPVLRLRRDGLILYANEASQELLQDWQALPGSCAPQFWCDLAVKVTLYQETISVDVPLGEHVFSILVVPVPGTNYVNLYGRDITDRRQAEARLQQVNQVLRALEQIHQLITRQPDPRRLLSQACSILVKNCNYRMAWIGMIESDNKQVVPVASAGEGTDYLNQITITWDESPTGLGPAGTSIRTRRACVSQDLADDPRFSPWRETAIQRGYAATLAAPMIWRERMFGTLVSYAPQPQAYSDEEINLLTDLAANLAFALQNHEEATRRKKAEEALQVYSVQLEEMVTQRAQQLQEVQEQLVRQERLAILGQLAGSVAHELRNPLGVISNAVYFLNLTLSGLDATTREYLDLITSEVHSAERIISDLLDFSRARFADRQETDLTELVAQVLEKFPAPANVRVENQVDPALPAAFVDPHQIEQVFANLIVNAYQAMPEGGQLTIGSQARPGQVCISLADTGCGIPPENLPKIFEPLFTTKARGIGLGLAVSRKMAQTNDGQIDVESRDGEGTTFTVLLPVTANSEASCARIS